MNGATWLIYIVNLIAKLREPAYLFYCACLPEKKKRYREIDIKIYPMQAALRMSSSKETKRRVS